MLRSYKNVIAITFAAALSACGGGKAPADSPQNIIVTPGDSRVIVSWTQESDLTYWIFRARAALITRDDYAKSPEAHIDSPVNSPRSVTGLTNDETYSFIMNATKNAGPAGPASSSLSAIPRLAGNTWTIQSTSPGGGDLRDVVHATLNAVDNFYAVGSGATILKGTEVLDPSDNAKNAIAWTLLTPPANFSQNLNGIAFNSGGPKFVAIGDAGAVVTSTDGVTWTAGTVSTTATPKLNSIAFSGSTYVAVGDGDVTYSSGDGSTWTPHTATGAVTLNAVAYLAGQFITVGANGFIATSPDGATWSPQTPPTSNSLRAVAYGASKFLSAGVVTTADAAYVIVGDAGTILTSSDSSNWRPPTIPPPTVTQNLYDVYFGSRFIAVGAGGTVVTSTADSPTNLQWQPTTSGTNDLFATVFALGANVAVGVAGTNNYSW